MAIKWHERLAHVGFETLARISSTTLVLGPSLKPADFLQVRRDIVREACIETKHASKPHTTPSIRDRKSVV